eukprot:CAMPEP_0202109482 /NCGR_PEP_ID=MMETSP0965-20130614/23904_1 /ASSEMBLY_ACC=CAM_ASM_000507 /TAXON_ID=4773 /ORGANISM="Schizochytrium aggregatum, Strain ATCC28209" /LENGTH=58 /DNA_ID=CAMNT_0048678821 /DNA_START=278 /DNA_END=451 /DNA_ORIENTATION=+
MVAKVLDKVGHASVIIVGLGLCEAVRPSRRRGPFHSKRNMRDVLSFSHANPTVDVGAA